MTRLLGQAKDDPEKRHPIESKTYCTGIVTCGPSLGGVNGRAYGQSQSQDIYGSSATVMLCRVNDTGRLHHPQHEVGNCPQHVIMLTFMMTAYVCREFRRGKDQDIPIGQA